MRHGKKGYVTASTPLPFPRAARYPRPEQDPGRRVREEVPGLASLSERHLQCVWMDPRYRPARLATVTGELATVLDPGIWNLEAGPDFQGAMLELHPGKRRLYGDVEIHIRPSGWKGHGHHLDPRYRGVRVHVTYYPGCVPAGLLPPGAVEMALQPALAADPLFSFDMLDLTAYPFGSRATVPPCSELLAEWSPDEAGALLDAAGEERLRRKTQRLIHAAHARGADQALYEEVLSALGYKHNKLPFRRLAQHLPHDELRAEAGGSILNAYALLAGVAGLLPTQVNPAWSRATRAFVRDIWDRWWKRRERWEPRVMERSAWRLGGLRPANHPLRRLMAAALLFTRQETLARQWRHLAARDPDRCVERVQRQLAAASETYWDHHTSLGGKRSPTRVALIGPGRARSLIVNVLVPWLAADDGKNALRKAQLDRLPAESSNQIARQAAFFLFGPDHTSKLYRSGLRRQGLIQIFHDFCLNDRSRCAACTFPSLLRAHRARITAPDDPAEPNA